MYRNYPNFLGAWKSVYTLDLLRIQDDVMAWNVAILSPVCVKIKNGFLFEFTTGFYGGIWYNFGADDVRKMVVTCVVTLEW